MIQFDRAEAEKDLSASWAKRLKIQLTKFFKDKENLQLLDRDAFDTLYIKWQITKWDPGALTAFLLLSNIDFISHMTSIPSYCFNDSFIEYIEVPKNIKYIRSYAFYLCRLTEIYYEGTMKEWADISKETYWYASDTRSKGIKKVICTDGELSV